MKQNEKIGKFCVLIVAALLVTSVAVSLALAAPPPYPTTPPTPPVPPVPPGAMPDLIIEDKWETFAKGQVIVHFTVKNIGDAQARKSTACKYIGGIEVDSVRIPKLGPDTSCTRAFAAEPCPSGKTITIKVCADNYDVVVERNENNNCKVNTVTCPIVPPSKKPDLVVTKSVEKTIVGGQVRYTVSATVTNNGNADAGGSTTCLYVDGVEVATDGCPKLGPGASSSNIFGARVCPVGTTITVKVCADNTKVVDESNEGNNCEVNTVLCCKPSIDVTKRVFDPALGLWVTARNAVINDNVQFRCTIHNDGLCCNLAQITVTDVLSKSLKYTGVGANTPAPTTEKLNADGSTTLTWILPDTLTPCQTKVFIINAQVVGFGVDTNKQSAVATSSCTGETVSDSDTATVNVAAAEGLDVDKKVWDPVTLTWEDAIILPANANPVLVRFMCTVENIGSVDLTGVEVWDDLDPAFTNIVAVPAAFTWGTTTLYWNLGDLRAGTTQTYIITATVPGGTAAGDLCNEQRARGKAGTWLFDREDAIVTQL